MIDVEDVRDAFIDRGYDGDGYINPPGSPKEFDEWLREIRAEAWDEAVEAIEGPDWGVPNNPYRKETS